MGRNEPKLIDANKLIEKVHILKEEAQEETGSFKYDFCYDEVIETIKHYL